MEPRVNNWNKIRSLTLILFASLLFQTRCEQQTAQPADHLPVEVLATVEYGRVNVLDQLPTLFSYSYLLDGDIYSHSRKTLNLQLGIGQPLKEQHSANYFVNAGNARVIAIHVKEASYCNCREENDGGGCSASIIAGLDEAIASSISATAISMIKITDIPSIIEVSLAGLSFTERIKNQLTNIKDEINKTSQVEQEIIATNPKQVGEIKSPNNFIQQFSNITRHCQLAAEVSTTNKSNMLNQITIIGEQFII